MCMDSIHYINQKDHWENVCPEINMAHNKSWKWKPCHKWTANWLPISDMNEGHGILWSKSSSVADGKELNEASSYQIGPSHSANQQAPCQELRTSNLDYRNTKMTMPVSHGCHFKAKVTAYQFGVWCHSIPGWLLLEAWETFKTSSDDKSDTMVNSSFSSVYILTHWGKKWWYFENISGNFNERKMKQPQLHNVGSGAQ